MSSKTPKHVECPISRTFLHLIIITIDVFQTNNVLIATLGQISLKISLVQNIYQNYFFFTYSFGIISAVNLRLC